MQQIVFLTLFLGLTSGLQTVVVQTAPDVKSVRIELDGRPVTTIERPPWSARVDFGMELVPRELVAIALDARGDEIARTAQTLNLPRRVAELEIVLSNEKDGAVVAQLVGSHRLHLPPRRASISVDGMKVRLDRDFRARLPRLDWSHTHVIAAEMRFKDGEVARRETVVQGGFADSTSSQLTPVVVTSDSLDAPESLADCFSLDGNPLRVNAVEKTNAIVIVIKDPDATEAMDALHAVMPTLPGWSKPTLHWMLGTDSRRLRTELRIDAESSQRIIWPIAKQYVAPGEPTYELFGSSGDFTASDGGMAWLLTRRWEFPPELSERRRFADAVAVAGISALSQGRRRAVVLLLGGAPDRSDSSPAAVRRYLERVGVPLFVWSFDGPRPDLSATWGSVDDISTSAGLTAAVSKLNRALLAQRVAWVAAAPLAALRLDVDDRCGVRLLARMRAEANGTATTTP